MRIVIFSLCVCVDYWEEEHSYSQGNWHQYQRDLLRELSCCDERDDEDDGGCTYDSD